MNRYFDFVWSLRRQWLLGLVVVTTIAHSVAVWAEDWPQWRGPQRDGVSQETGLLKSWPSAGPELVWKVAGLGAGYSSIAVADGQIYTLGDLDDGCYLIALNESTGQPVWQTRTGDSGGHRRYIGPRSTPTVDRGQIFALNQHGDLVCVDRQAGKVLWSRNLERDYGGEMMSGWRYSESPLVDGKQVVCTPGGSGGTLLALDRETGEKIWQTSEWTDSAGYSSVIIATIHGVRQYIQLTGRSVAGVDPQTGRVLWRADRPGKTAVVPTPIVDGDLVFVTSGYGVGCNAFRISKSGDAWSAEELYANTAIANHHGGVVRIGHFVFGSTNDTFRCLDLYDGELSFNARSVGKGATVFADGNLYLRSEKGPVALIKASTDQLEEVSSFEQPDRSEEKAWAHPVVANGRLYLRDQDILWCYDVKSD